MGTIKLRRGTGSPAGSLAANEVAMDTAAQVLYVSTDGSDAVQLADDSRNYLENVSYFLGDFQGLYPQTAVLGNNKISTYGTQNASIAIKTGQYAAGANKGPVQIDALSLDMDSNPIINAESLTIKDTIGTNPDMTLTQDQYTPNGIEIKADKAEAGKRSELWWNYDDAGTKEYVGQLMWQADGGDSTASGDHYFRLASYKNGPNSDLIFDSWKNHHTRISNGFHTSGNNAPIGYLELTQDKVNMNMRLDIQNGRTNSGGGLSPHALFCETDMSQDTNIDIMNSATFNTKYGSQTKLDGIQNTISFGIENDADGYSSIGRMMAVYNADGLNNQFKIQSNNEAGSGANTLEGGVIVGSGNGKADITCLAFSTNVPYQLPKYSVAQLATLSAGEGMQVYCLDGNSGSGCLAVYDGTNWNRVALGAPVST
jgi:hypothetical protein